jgi:hypothetical protein
VYHRFTSRGIKSASIENQHCTSEASRFHFDLLRVKKDEGGSGRRQQRAEHVAENPYYRNIKKQLRQRMECD